ncbi:MAG: beta-phosphoglucomutase [Phycisphaerae bacterium]
MQLGVIFDMDGVLVLTEEAHWLSWQDVAKSRGVDLEYQTFLSCFGRVNADCIRIMFGDAIPPAEALSIADAKEAAFRELVRKNVPLAPGTTPLLQSLRARGARIGIGSSAPPENVDLVLDAGNIRAYFDAVIDGSQVTRGKPAPEVFLKAGVGLGVDPRRCAVIEDAPPGIEAARAAGMTAIGVATTHTRDQLAGAGAHAIFDDVRSLSAELIASCIDQHGRR